uniref:Uncharacterized protein n=1 Tax=Tetranychus urticae TaxID=32264 RepID=T1KU20_TETUR
MENVYSNDPPLCSMAETIWIDSDYYNDLLKVAFKSRGSGQSRPLMRNKYPLQD